MYVSSHRLAAALTLTALLACNGDDAADPTATATDTDTDTSAGTSAASTTAASTTAGTTTASSESDATTDPTPGTTDPSTTTDSTTTDGTTTDGTTTDGVTTDGTDTDTDTDTGGAIDPFPVYVGEVGPIAEDNPRQFPFACRTADIGLGQPEIDNQDAEGLPILGDNDEVLGWSRDCGAKTRVDYFYKPIVPPEGGGLLPYDPLDPPDDVAMLELNGELRRYVVRYERGTINRFVYGIAVIAPEETDPAIPDLSAWNERLLFWFGGGVGIGYQQASGLAVNRLRTDTYKQPLRDGPLFEPFLEQGYAIAYSSGTVTDTTYNLELTGQTAVMVKKQFEAMYYPPKYTFGLGASGGAIQQLIYAQNHPELLDGLVPTHSYTDMITQTIRVGDCELLEHYFDVTDGANPTWHTWAKRAKIEGLNAIDGYQGSDWDFLQQGKPTGSSAGPGSSECIEGWRGLTPLAMNPLWVDANAASYKQILTHQPDVFADTPWTYWDDLVTIFGVDPKSNKGYARRTWDNVGVQYGLTALLSGQISKSEFIALNAKVGGFIAPDDMVQEGFPFGSQDPQDFDVWSARNGTASLGLPVAPRTEADLGAVQEAYYRGLVFLGDIDHPTITIMPYLEPQLDMHNAKQPFAIRERMLEAKGEADNHLIWAISSEGADFYPAVGLAFDTLAAWLDSKKKPVDALDRCYTAGLSLTAEGPDAWSGALTSQPDDDGPCAALYPVYSDSRMVAGEDISGDIFKCATKPLTTALADGTYGALTWSPDEIAALEQIFGETGVCDYSKPDLGRPEDL
jgi:hypothetical protein